MSEKLNNYFNKKNIGWGVGEKFWSILLDALTLVLFAKLLGPEILGQYAILLLFIGLSSVLIEAGCSDAIIRQKENQKLEVTLFWIVILCSTLYASIVFLLSEIIARGLSYPGYSTSIIYLLPLITMNSLIVVPLARLKRDGAFHIISKRNIAVGLIGKLIAIAMAYLGYGLSSLIAMSLSAKVAEVILIFYVTKWLPVFVFDIVSLKKNTNFVIYLSASKMTNYFSKRIWVIIVAKYFGTEAVGLYDLALKLMNYALKLINGVLLPIFYSEISKKPNTISAQHNDVTVVITALYYPIIAFFILHSKELLLRVFGLEWQNASGLVMILFLSLRFLAQGGIASHILKSQGNSKSIFSAVLFSSFVLLVFMYLSASFKILEFVAISYLISVLALMIFLYGTFPKSLKIDYNYCVKSEVQMMVITGLFSWVMILGRNYFFKESHLFSFLIYSALFFASFFLIVSIFHRQALNTVINLLNGKLRDSKVVHKSSS